MALTTSERTFIYQVDADNRVVFVTPEWESFAQENQASHLDSETVCGQSLFGFVSDAETRHLYQMLIDKVRQGRRTIVIPFRCDGPHVRRFMELTISPWTDGQIQFEGRIVREEDRETVSLLDPSVSRSDEYVVVCSWCKRVDVSGAWVEVEEAVRALTLFDAIDLPQITHGMCVDCATRIGDQIDDAG